MNLGDNLKTNWRRSVAEQILDLTGKFKKVESDLDRLKLCWEALRKDPCLINTVDKLRTEIVEAHADSRGSSVEHLLEVAVNSSDEDNCVLPALAQGKHPKIANGSALIQLSCSKSQGRYLEAKERIKAGDVLILESPYAAVLLPDNRATHCSHCFSLLETKYFPCHICKLKYCCDGCKRDAWRKYHREECFLRPLMEMLEISSHLALRLLLVTGRERLLKFVQEKNNQDKACKDSSFLDKISGCTTAGLYPGDYGCVYSLVTNTELQPTEALVSYALDSALITDIAFEHIYGRRKDKILDGDRNAELLETVACDSNAGITKEIMGCLLLHHMQQMPCNIHAITAIVSTDEKSKTGVASKEQRRIAVGIYPTASLLNHACDPDVIVSFLGRNLVVRATHNINPGEEIAHCYGPSASRMTREVRQSLLQKQYFFTCGCAACKSDKELEEQDLYATVFSCPKCSSSVVVSGQNGRSVGKCQNSKCGCTKDFSIEIETIREAQGLFNRAVQHLEDGSVQKSVSVLKGCLKKRQEVLQKYDKDVAETHDVLARCYATLGDFRQASFHCEQSTESVRRRFGSESIEYAHELYKFAQLLFNGRQVNKASSIIDNAIRLLSIHYGGQYSDVEELQEMKKTLKDFLKGRT